jgi:hypothetical protein
VLDWVVRYLAKRYAIRKSKDLKILISRNNTRIAMSEKQARPRNDIILLVGEGIYIFGI